MNASQPPSLIVFGGLPGTGKTTISRQLTQRLGATYLRVDAIEQSLPAGGMPIGISGYVIANALAAENLQLGRTVIVDCVNPVLASRTGWRETAIRTSARIVEIEIVCGDASEHRRRLERRSADIAGHLLPTWDDVIQRPYDPWDRDRLIIDTATSSVARSVQRIEALLRGTHG